MKKRAVCTISVIAVLTLSFFLANAPKVHALGSPQWLHIAQVRTPTAPTNRTHVSATVKYDMPGRGGRQTVYIRVLDAAGRGLPNVPVTVQVYDRYDRRPYIAPATNAKGYTSYTFAIGEPWPGYTVLVDVIAHYRGQVRAKTSYTPWY